MSIAFDHVQYAVDMRLALGEATSEIQYEAPFTDQEFYRTRLDPGFDGDISYLEADMLFEGSVSVVQNVTWKWQVRSKGQSVWTDLHAAVTEQWTGGTATGVRVVLEASSLGVNTKVPMEVRVIVSASTVATVSVRIGGSHKTPSMRVIGDSA